MSSSSDEDDLPDLESVDSSEVSVRAPPTDSICVIRLARLVVLGAWVVGLNLRNIIRPPYFVLMPARNKHYKNLI